MKSFSLKSTLLLSSLVLMGGVANANVKIGNYRVSPVVKLTMPATPASGTKENKFDNSQLLDARAARFFRSQLADWTTMQTDSTGRLNLVGSTNAPQLQTLATRIRAERFVKGKLKLKSSPMAEVFVNGKSVAKKTTADSIPSEVSANLSLNPEADYDIIVNVVSQPTDKVAPTVVLEFIPDNDFAEIPVVAGANIGRRFSTLSTMTGDRVASATLSPDGKYILLKYSQVFSARETVWHASIQETATGRMISENANVYANWMPTGSSLFYTQYVNGTYNLVSIELPTMKESVVARNLPTNSITFAPNGKSFVYYKGVDGKKEQGIMRRIESPDDRQPGFRDRSYIQRYDLATGTTTTLTYGGKTTSINDISNDGKKLLYTSTEMRPEEYPQYFNTLIQLDMETLKTDTLIRNEGFINSACYSPDAKQLFLVGSPQAFNQLGANAGNHPIPNDYDGQGYIFTIADGSVKAMTKDFDPAVVGNVIWNQKDNQIYFRGETGFFNFIYCLNPTTGKITKVNTPDVDNVSNFSISDLQPNWIAYTGGGYSNTGVAGLMNTKTGRDRLLANPMSEELAEIEFGKTEPWKFTSSDGTEIDGFICLPPNFDPNKKYPLIVYYYGGTSPSQAAITNPYSPQVFASRDYVVYVLNPSGTTGYGQEFSARHVNAWGKRTAEDIIEGVKKFMDEHPFVDRKRVGCLGASYGGFMTQYLQTLTDIFAAAVSHAGISNVTSYWGEGYWGYSYNNVAAAKTYPWTNPELYTKQGSLFNADKIHTPLLLLHGTVDTNVPIGESIQIFNALKMLGRDVEFITVDGANHVVTEFDKKLVWQDTIMAWFAKYLQGDSKWWDSMYGN